MLPPIKPVVNSVIFILLLHSLITHFGPYPVTESNSEEAFDASPKMSGPLGDLAGLTWDPVKQKYFPTTAAPRTVGPPTMDSLRPVPARAQGRLTRAGGRSGTYVKSDNQQIKKGHDAEQIGGSGGVFKRQRTEGASYRRSALPRDYHAANWQDRNIVRQAANLTLADRINIPTCCNDYITSFHFYGDSSYWAATGHGHIAEYSPQDDILEVIGACSSGVAFSHLDIPRMVRLVVSASADNDDLHVHITRRRPDNPDAQEEEETVDVPGSRTKDVYAACASDGRISISSTRSIHTLSYEGNSKWQSRKMPSDPLSLYHVDRDHIYAGLRNGSVHLVDLRSKPSALTDTGIRSVGGKAVVGVKRLNDGAVPFGLIVSALQDEITIFDIRFPSTPLHSLSGHHNRSYPFLGWAFSPDDRILFAASARTDPGSRRNNNINAWDLVRGEKLEAFHHPTQHWTSPTPYHNDNNIIGDKKWTGIHQVRALQCHEGPDGRLRLDVAVGSAIQRCIIRDRDMRYWPGA